MKLLRSLFRNCTGHASPSSCGTSVPFGFHQVFAGQQERYIHPRGPISRVRLSESHVYWPNKEGQNGDTQESATIHGSWSLTELAQVRNDSEFDVDPGHSCINKTDHLMLVYDSSGVVPLRDLRREYPAHLRHFPPEKMSIIITHSFTEREIDSLPC